MYIRVRVTPSAKREKIQQVNSTQYEIAVREPASRNCANRRVHEILQHELAIPAQAIKLITGHRSPVKVFAIELPL